MMVLSPITTSKLKIGGLYQKIDFSKTNRGGYLSIFLNFDALESSLVSIKKYNSICFAYIN